MTSNIKEIGYLEKLFSESVDLYEPEKADLYAQALYEYIESRIGLDHVEIFSFDVFDTLLLRNEKYELYRFLEIAERVHKLLTVKGITNLSVWDIYAARLTAFRICYRTVNHTHKIREGKLIDVLALMSKILGLEVWIVPEIVRIELTYEEENLRVNPFLDTFLSYLDIKAKKIIFISDMYLPGDWIDKLVLKYYPSLELRKYYSSADSSLTKSSGLLYDFAIKELKVSRAAIVHMGDNFYSDVQCAKERGLRAIHLPIPQKQLQVREQEKQKFRTELTAQGFDLSLVY